jgi:hypothetical protein
MKALTIYRAKDLAQAAHRQKSIPDATPFSQEQQDHWRDLESLLVKRREQYFNGDDGNIWMIVDDLFLYKVSEVKPIHEKVRIVGILRQNEDSKELVFDSEMFDNTDEHRSYARKNNLLLA